MKPLHPETAAPDDAAARRAVAPVVSYPADAVARPDAAVLARLRTGLTLTDRIIVPPREARAFRVPKGHVFHILSHEGP